jgi:acyl dehydratase
MANPTATANPRIINGLDELRTLTGTEVGVSDWMPVTQEMINRFADVTGDHQWIHVDVERARRETPFQSTIAHGFLTVSLLSELSKRTIEVRGDFKMRINYGFNKLRFVSPVPAGARIRARFTPLQVTENEVTWQVTVEVEGREKPALVAEWLGRFY